MLSKLVIICTHILLLFNRHHAFQQKLFPSRCCSWSDLHLFFFFVALQPAEIHRVSSPSFRLLCRSFSTFHHTTHQARVDILQPIFEAPLCPLVPLPRLPLSTSLLSFSSTPPPPHALPVSISLSPIADRFASPMGPVSTCSSVPTLIPVSTCTVPDQPPFSSPFFCSAPLPSSQSPTATLQSTNTQTQSSSSSSGDGSLFRQIGSQAAQPDETGRVCPYVDFSQFYRLWGGDHSDGQSTQGGLGPQ